MAGYIDFLYQSHPKPCFDETVALTNGANEKAELFANRLQLRPPGLPALRRRQVELPSGILSVIPDDLLPTPSAPQTTNPPQKSSRGGDNDNNPRRTDDEKGNTRPTRTTDDVTEPSRGAARSAANQDSKQTDKASPRTEDSEGKTSKSGGQTDSTKASPSTTTPPRTTTDSSTSETTTTESSTDPSTSITATTPSSAEPSQTSSGLVSRSVTSTEASPVISTSSTSSQPSNTTPNSVVASNAASSTAKPSSASSFKSPISETGIVVASVSATAVLIGIILLIVFCVRRRKQRRVIAKNVTDEMYLEKQLEENSAGGIRRNTSGLGVIEPSLEPPTTTNRGYGSPPVAPWQPPTESQPAIPSPVAMHPPSAAPWHAPTDEPTTVPSPAPIHPPGGYTRHPRTSRLRSSTLQASEAKTPQRPLSQQAMNADQDIEDLRRSNSLPLQTSYHSPQPIPPQSVQPSSPAHQLQPAPQQPYQAYRPFASRYQVPNTIPEEDLRGGNQHPSPGPRTYLPGERTRTPQNGKEVPASLLVGR